MPPKKTVYDENQKLLRDALNAYNARPKAVLEHVAEEFGVSPSSLAGRVKGAKPAAQEYKERQILSEQQEKAIVRFIERVDDLGFPCKASFVKELAESMLPEDFQFQNKTEDGLGVQFVSKFLRRHPKLVKKFVSRIDRQRTAAQNLLVFKIFFRKLGNLFRDHQIQPESIFNMVEKGFMIGQSHRVSRICRKGRRNPRLIQEGVRELVTVIEVVSADGRCYPPLVIHCGKKHTHGNLAHAHLLPGTTFHNSAKAWTNYEIGLQWLDHLENVCDASQRSSKHVLILDGHSSHCNYDFFSTCLDRDIIPVCLPPHATHKLLPLDVGLFGPLARSYVEELDKWTSAGNKNVNRGDFFELYVKARNSAYSVANIKSSFSSTGIHLFNPHRVELPKTARHTGQYVAPSPARVTAPRIIPPPLIPRAPRQGARLARELLAMLHKPREELDLNAITVGIQKLGAAYEDAKADLDIERFERQYSQRGQQESSKSGPLRATQDRRQLPIIGPVTSEHAVALLRVREAKEAAAAEKKARAEERKQVALAKNAPKSAPKNASRTGSKGKGKGKEVVLVEEPDVVEFSDWSTSDSDDDELVEDVWHNLQDDGSLVREVEMRKKSELYIERAKEVTTRSGRVSKRPEKQ